MPCPRCHSLLIPEVFVDHEADGESMSFLGYRCVICGNILDATILRHHDRHVPPIFSRARRRRLPVLAGRTHGPDGDKPSRGSA